MDAAPQRPAPPMVYLDMNVWVSMARGLARDEAGWIAAHALLTEAVARERCVVPLSAAHYLELWHRADEGSREKVGTLMRDLSRYRALLPTRSVRRMEVRSSVMELVTGHPLPLGRDVVLGTGAAFAFQSPDGRFRFVEALAASDGSSPEGPETQPPPGWDAIRRSGPAWEWLQLVGTQEIIDIEGLDRTPEHRHGTAHMQDEVALGTMLSTDSRTRSRLRELIMALELTSLLDHINDVARDLDVDPRVLLSDERLGSTDAERIESFMSRLPSALTWATIRHWKHRDPNQPWEQHDWTDLAALSVAVPYCDAVITEKRWAHAVVTTKLADRFGTVVDHGSRGVHDLLTRILDG